MKRSISALWADESGFVLSAELVLISTVGILGLTVMLVAVRDAIGSELTDLANAFQNIDQSYGYGGMKGCQTRNGYTSYTAGSAYLDERLRERGSEQDIIVEDHVVGTSLLGEKIPCHPPVQAAPVCPAPVCPLPVMTNPVIPGTDCITPDCRQPILQVPQFPEGADVQGMASPSVSPVLKAPCLECQQSPGQYGVQYEGRPTPSSDIPPSAVYRNRNPYYPQFYLPVPKVPAGPLQVW